MYHEYNNTYREQFIVFPRQSNHLAPLIFGGAFMEKLDLCIANCIRNFLMSAPNDGEILDAVTFIFDVKFSGPSFVGELIEMVAQVEDAHGKTISGTCRARRINLYEPPDDICEVKFTFVTVAKGTDLSSRPKKLPYKEHGLKYSVHR